ncbi:diacylglycerol/lipid kinase family protein [Variovorax sp. LT1R16]|uniref:diacylglycerol/lipid kinase family protein n=1 Tax=Variovorax sp. LT1R16 TaxID=3443728 RepID=UPI003F4613E0
MQPPIHGTDAPLFIVLSASSGRRDKNEVRQLIEATCSEAHRACTIFLVDGPGKLQKLAREAVEQAEACDGIVVAAGGDGTINAVAQATLGTGCAFGVLPQGTFNYFSRTHGIPADTAEALQVLLNQAPRRVQVGLVNDRVFLVNASLGLYAQLLEERETFKRDYGRSRMVALGAAVMTMVRGGHRTWRLRLTARGQARDLRTRSLFVGNNALQLHQVGITHADAPEEGQLAAIAIKPSGWWSLPALLVRGALGRLGSAEDILSFPFTSMTVDTAGSRRGRRIKIATDGELGWLEMPLTFRVSPEPLWLIRPGVAPELEAAKA